MILRKPYAFLIKYFKIINLALAILASYVAYRYYHIITFFNEYIYNNYSANYYPGFYEEYLNFFLYVAVIVIIVGIGGILLLFINKKKPCKDYLLSIGYYLAFFIGLSLVKNTMISMETTAITAETARLYRDLVLIAIIPQIPCIILFFMRGFGVNIEKFNFKEDIKDLEITNEDDEEIEITFKGDTVKLKRNVRRFFREFTYYVKENKFIFTIICIVLLLVGGSSLYKSIPKNVDSKYKQGDYFTSLGLKYSITDSIVTNLNYRGEVIKEGAYYVVSKLYIENSSNQSYTIDFNRFRLEVGKELYYPVVDKGVHFIDYAKNNTGTTIAKESNVTYTLVFEIDKKNIKKNYRIKVDGGITSNKKELVGSFNYVTISPILIDSVSIDSTYNLGKEINFSSSNLKNTKLKLDNVEFTNKYIYNYEFCTKYENCSTYVGQVTNNNLKNNTTLIVLDYEYTIDKDIPFYTANSNIKNLINSFAKIRYLINKKDEYAIVEDVTPSNLKGKIVLETTNKINDADEIVLILTIRNKEYLIKLK